MEEIAGLFADTETSTGENANYLNGRDIAGRLTPTWRHRDIYR